MNDRHESDESTSMTGTVDASPRSSLRFLVPSLIGIFLFMVPIPGEDGSPTIPIAYAAGMAGDRVGDAIPWLLLCIATFSAIGTALFTFARPSFLDNSVGRPLFKTSPFWLIIRVLGCLITAAIIFQLGPEAVWGDSTGAVILDLAGMLVIIFALAGLMLPLLLSFGLLDFAGTLMTRVMRPLFRLPGRSSVIGLTSWLGDGTIGVLMINQQYTHGHYTKREAATLGTTFSIVSVTFIVVILQTLSIEHMFAPFYLTLIVAGLVCAIILPRIPPLSMFSDTYAEEAGSVPAQNREPEDSTGSSDSLLGRAWSSAVRRGGQARLGEVVKNGITNALEMWMAVIPIILAVGTIAVIIAEHTPLFSWLGTPFVPLLELLQVPEAKAASETMLIGFADMLLPAIIGSGIETEITRFIIGAIAVTQLIFMSETGGVLLASKIPVRFHHLVIIFLLRTLISLPVIVLLAHLFY